MTTKTVCASEERYFSEDLGCRWLLLCEVEGNDQLYILIMHIVLAYLDATGISPIFNVSILPRRGQSAGD